MRSELRVEGGVVAIIGKIVGDWPPPLVPLGVEPSNAFHGVM